MLRSRKLPRLASLVSLSLVFATGCSGESGDPGSPLHGGGDTGGTNGGVDPGPGEIDPPPELCRTNPEKCETVVDADCGNGELDTGEACDDGNRTASDGCDARCRLEEGNACDEPGKACRKTTCGDGKVEGTERCDDGELLGRDGELGSADDGDVRPYDGCSLDCKKEPRCAGGRCEATCGDGLVMAPEACDDGNTVDRDGCSSKCVLEAGFACENETAEAPKELALPIVYRDFWVSYLSGFSWSDAEKGTRVANTDERAHPDFEQRIRRSDDAPVTGMVKAALGQDGKPVYDEAITAKTTQHLTHGKDRFAEWFRDVPGKNVTRVQKLILTRQGSGDTYAFDSGDDEFFPLDACPEASCEGKRTLEPLEASWGPARTHNFGFTSEVHHWFTYRGGETLTFSGDDDVWVFVDGRLVVDLGGLHPEVTASVTLSADTKSADGKALGLIPGGIYQIDVFHAERQATGSNYRLTLGGFSQVRTACDEKCGDGKVSGLEACDDGNTRDGDGCSAQCRRETEIIR